MEWQTKALASFIAATAWAGGDKLLEAVQKLTLITPSTKREVKDADTSNEPARGSFERFAGMMGQKLGPPQETREDVQSVDTGPQPIE